MTATIGLNDGTSIPQLGFGTYLVPPQDTQAIVSTALEVGYRHIDTAQMYGNEAEVGRAVAASGLPRDELYLTSKLDNGNHRPGDVRRTFAESLARLGVDRLDLFLIHWPLPTLYDGDYVSTWQAVAGLVEEGALRTAGVSNFEPEHLDRIIGETGVIPAVNQIEVHPYFPNERARAASLSHGIAVEAWGPLGQGAVLGDEVIAGIAERTGRSPAQVILRWHIQRGDVVFPKSSSRARMEENARIFDFDLSPQDMAAIDGLDRGPRGRGGPDPTTFAYLP
ncbi:aldo/keto reductase [Streptomyces sp. NPDC059853]|uniref:aldo/keto reductase n=1 Tax=Streptomyces sp. NPDC059853 TaxID=3346973 RepID=UPI0036649A31